VQKLTFIFCLYLLPFTQASTPSFRGKIAIYDTVINAGEIIVNEKLGSLLTFQPALLWNIPSFSSRMGIHYNLDMMSRLGATPITGIGFSGYYYFKGLSSYADSLQDVVLIQKTRAGFYTFAQFTPVNVNLNRIDGVNPLNNFAISAFMFETTLGFGYEYPLEPNSIIAIELARREGTFGGSGSGIQYSGLGISISYITSYF
jgi:hypothetical protein